jgi:hypothetical protein
LYFLCLIQIVQQCEAAPAAGCTTGSDTVICIKHESGVFHVNTGNGWFQQEQILLFIGVTYTFHTSAIGDFTANPFGLSYETASYVQFDNFAPITGNDVQRTYTPAAQSTAYYVSTTNTDMGGTATFTVGCSLISDPLNICIRHTGTDTGVFEIHTGTDWVSQPSLVLVMGKAYVFLGAATSVGSFVDYPFRLSSTASTYTATSDDIDVSSNGMINSAGGMIVFFTPSDSQLQIYYVSTTKPNMGGSMLITSK